jgi:hypothetical protein
VKFKQISDLYYLGSITGDFLFAENSTISTPPNRTVNTDPSIPMYRQQQQQPTTYSYQTPPPQQQQPPSSNVKLSSKIYLFYFIINI